MQKIGRRAVRKTVADRIREKTAKRLGDLSGVAIPDLCVLYEAAAQASEVWVATLQKPRIDGEGNWSDGPMEKQYDWCFSIRQLIAWELAKRLDAKGEAAHRRMRVLADWCATMEGEEEDIVLALQGAVSMICPDCGFAGHEAHRSCCDAKVAA